MHHIVIINNVVKVLIPNKSKSTNVLPPISKNKPDEQEICRHLERHLRVYGKGIQPTSSNTLEPHQPMLMTYHKVPPQNKNL